MESFCTFYHKCEQIAKVQYTHGLRHVSCSRQCYKGVESTHC